MNEPALTLHVRFKSKLTLDEVMKIIDERAPEFRALEGLQQKYYLQDAATGEYGGLYLWDSPESLKSYRESDLAASIPEAYEIIEAPNIEILDVLFQLRK